MKILKIWDFNEKGKGALGYVILVFLRVWDEVLGSRDSNFLGKNGFWEIL